MPVPYQLVLSPQARAQLEHAARTDRRPYYRERCWAVLQVADGASIRAVARAGLGRPRKPDTVCTWIARYTRDGLAGLVQHARRTRGVPP